MNKILNLFVLVMLTGSSSPVLKADTCIPFSLNTQLCSRDVIVKFSYRGSTGTFGGVNRSGSQSVLQVIQCGHYFKELPFKAPCIIELLSDNGELLYKQIVDKPNKGVYIPENFKGSFTLRITFSSAIYEGHIELE